MMPGGKENETIDDGISHLIPPLGYKLCSQ